MEEHYSTLTQMATILAAAFLGGTLIQTMRQPVLVGYIIVGVLIGPSVLGIIHDRHQIEFLAELGILLLLFIVGIELNLKRFVPVYKIALATTGFQICIGLLAMTVMGMFLDWPIARVILFGFALSLSSTAVAIKLLQEHNELDSDMGRMTVGILIAQDIAVIPMLLIVSAMGGDGFDPLDIVKIIAAVGFLGLVIFIINKKAEWVSAIVEVIPSGSQSAIIALTLCFSAAAIAGVLGLSPGYGAFLAGLIIGNTAKSHVYEENVKPIFDVLIMVFFISIGLLIDIQFLWDHLGVILILLLVTMFIKTSANIFILKLQGVATHQAFTIGAKLGQIGEFSFMLAALGFSIGTIMPEGYKYVVSVIALSLAITPVWLYVMRRVPLLPRYGLMRKLAEKNDPKGVL